MVQLHGFAKTRQSNIMTDAKKHVLFEQTTNQYREVVNFYLAIFERHQEILGIASWLLAAESLTHRTKSNPHPKYDFSLLYVKYPSGFRRAAIAEAYGQATSWLKRYNKWQEKRKKQTELNISRIAKGKREIPFSEHPPQYPTSCTTWLSYYGTEYERLDENHVMLKVFTGLSYKRIKIALLQPFKLETQYAEGSPTLVYKNKTWTLKTPTVLPKKEANLQKLEDRLKDPNFKMCVVDLGMNTHAAITIQDLEGRVLATKFISGAADNHLRKRRLEQIVNLQKQTGTICEGEKFAINLWKKISHHNDYIAHKVSKQIVDFAAKHDCKTIVFEHLANLRPSKGTKSHYLNQRFMFWVKGRIVNYTKYKSLHQGIVVNRVTPKNSSRRCPNCGFLTIIRYAQGLKYGVSLAHCTNCKLHDVNSDYVGSLGIGTNFRIRYVN
jgi:putative transposase